MSVQDGCDKSLTVAGFVEKIPKLPPGGGRAAAGGTSGGRARRNNGDASKMPRNTKWIAVTRLPGRELRYRVQHGSTVRYLSGLLCMHDVIECVMEKHTHG